MKVLITGRGAFSDLLAERLKREKHDVYVISGKDKGEHSGKYINYRFELTDERLDFAIYSIMPDAVVFLGALDEARDFSSGRSAAMDYVAGLTNLLAAASELGVPRFVYLSSCSVYGASPSGTLTEDAPKKPEDLKSLVISEGESLCFEFGGLSGMKSVVLRFSEVYGTGCEASDLCAPLFAEAMDPARDPAKDFAPSADLTVCPLYVLDAVDAVYKAIASETGEGGIYNVSAPAVKLSHIYQKIAELTGVDREGAENGAAPAPDLIVDSSAFSKQYGFKPIVDIDAGLTRAHRAASKRRGKEKQPDARKKRMNIQGAVKPFLENFLVFAAAVALSLYAQSAAALGNVNFLILYVVIIAITFGLFQASISIILASVYIMWRMASGGLGFFNMIIDLQTTLGVLELVVFGVICGYARDKMNTVVFEKTQALEDSQKELKTIHQINESNIAIKRTLDNRLKNYEDSLAKIYSIVDKLNYLQPDAVFFSAVGVVMEIMKSSDVSIYIVTGGSFKMCRLMAKTPSSTRAQRKSIPLTELGVMAQSLERNEIFVNRELKDDMPMMAAPIFSRGELASIIMLWAVEFDGLTTYNVNRFLVLSQLISSIIERAYVYTQSLNDSMCLPGTSILTASAFADVLRTHREAAKNNTTSCATILVSETDPETGRMTDCVELSRKVKVLLRSTDYLGQHEDDENKLYILLTNTNADELRFVCDRLAKNGVTVEEAEL